jgi:hypothetical protein
MQNKQLRFTDEEIDLMKRLFAENDPLLIAMRKALFGYELSTNEKTMLKQLKSDQAEALVRGVFKPELNPDAPIFQQANDLWATVPIMELDPTSAKHHIDATVVLEEYLDGALDRMLGGKFNKTLAELRNPRGKDEYDAYVDLLAGNKLRNHVEIHLNLLKVVGGQKEETAEQAKERLLRDSAK